MPGGAKGRRVKVKPTTTARTSPHTPQRTYKDYENIKYSALPPMSSKHALEVRKKLHRKAKQHTHPGFYSTQQSKTPKTPAYMTLLNNMRAKYPPAGVLFPDCKRRLVYANA